MLKMIRAQWIVPISRPPIQDGALLIHRDRILQVCKATSLIKNYPKVLIEDLGSSMVLPPLVNAHTHLEYSCLKGKIKPSQKFTDWLEQMMTLRHLLTPEEMIRGIQNTVKSLKKTGTGLIGEVTNTGLAAPILQKEGLRGSIFYELVGNNSTLKDYFKIEKKLRREAPSFKIAPACHAPHTVPEKLLLEMRSHLNKTKAITSIHLAESLEETEWIQHHQGPFAKLFEPFPKLSKNSKLGQGLGAIEYLQKHHFLNPRVLCVHCVDPLPREIQKLKKIHCPVVLCPRSNLYTGAGIAPLKKLISARIPLALGTDSLASNTDLDLWNEMRALKNLFPFLSYPIILRMATLNGAQALGFGKEYGSLERGKKARFIYVQTESQKIKDPLSFLIEESHEEINGYNS
ncbi:MAG: amidohydrolase family protein [Chlamydiae bacterium]|nr:amidohydrolase family protein [Chlamydiota bacterium]